MPKFTKRSSRHSFKTKKVSYLLESGSIKSIRQAKETTDELLKYHWAYYSELARQRNEIQDKIQQAVIQTCIPYELTHWQRAVKYKYGLHPFSTAGSLSFIGGRFNTGKGVNTEVPYFSGLYIAENKDTALQEHLGQVKHDQLTPREVALTNPASETIVSISGKIDKVFDLTNEKNLLPLVELIKDFKFSPELKKLSKKLGFSSPEIIKTSELLIQTLLTPEWRQLPCNYDIPANSQIFGHIIHQSGIEGILYPSKLTACLCLVVFPKNFVGTDSYLKLDDEAPHEKVPARIDTSNWRVCDLETKEIIG
ncbi:TPA: RES family NAD+ phosphorylase [Legionella pneumophila]|uniref:RES family NAD+ phosphorylase n=1 Tax=Legionella sp. PATHC039 TaxID=2992042 RepID=UPI001A2E1447|nr:RES family NAD+ phosphorylase [Legionella sp. PATHC039]BCL64452.1 hypothetical protein [Legionella pneumophila serogroup 7]HAT8858975.1 RES domain-containing protein [Legionella pneumophila subsp. pneumophila]HAU1397745.1 RES family NAD+ phosphorylase [Legionella pneumophila]MCW8395581.1 RES family NAD+ phosphorylase [Legionella sp. PATHC039]HAT9650708.1 RES domain-containing protein [Legionella pneumophila subsp. pneumophila]